MTGVGTGETYFSVIVPTLNEEPWVASAIRTARTALGPDAEIIVVDGGSRDRTVEIARESAQVIHCEAGRGRQLHAGATRANGHTLVFLHADTEMAPDAGAGIRRALEDPDVVGGCCRLAVRAAAGGSIRYALLEHGINLRTRLFRTATGDQVIFARRDAYRQTGGFPDVPLFEDVALVRSLRRVGRFQPIDAVARTSARRWERDGFIRTVTAHWLLRAAYLARIPPERLAAWYGLSRSR